MPKTFFLEDFGRCGPRVEGESCSENRRNEKFLKFGLFGK